MEQIRQAVERAKASGMPTAGPQVRTGAGQPAQHQADFSASRPDAAPQVKIREAELNREHLESRRIIAHNPADPRSSSFDMLRTQVLQSMDQRNWQFLAVTSPTPGCGITVTSD